jgi:hypothetical protein
MFRINVKINRAQKSNTPRKFGVFIGIRLIVKRLHLVGVVD